MHPLTLKNECKAGQCVPPALPGISAIYDFPVLRFCILALLFALLPLTIFSQSMPSILVPNAAVVEGNTGTTNLIFHILLSQASRDTVTLDYATRDVTAHSGLDYSSAFGVAVFPPGTTNVEVLVSANGDTWNEADKTFWLMLTNALHGILSKSYAVGTIVNDDPLPTLSITDAVLIDDGAGTTNAVFAVNASGNSARAITVDYETVGGTASAGSEFVPVADTLTFVPGLTRQLVSVPVFGAEKPAAVFFVNLSDAMNATIARGRAVATLLNNDRSPTIAQFQPAGSTNLVESNGALRDSSRPAPVTASKEVHIDALPIAIVKQPAENPQQNAAQTRLSDVVTSSNTPSALSAAALSFELTASTNFIHVEKDLVVSVTLTNFGGNATHSVFLTNWIPTTATFLSAKTSQGRTIRDKNLVIFDLGTLAAGAETTLNISMKLSAAGPATNVAQLASGEASVVFTNSPKSVVIVATNDLPVISPISPQFTLENRPAQPISINVSDTETPASELILLGSSSDPMLFPDRGFQFGGGGSNRILTVIPAQNKTGTAAITLTAIDSAGGETSAQFDMTVASGASLSIDRLEGLPPTKFEKIERVGDQVKLYFYAEAGLSYTLEGTDSFPPTGWQTLTNISAAPVTTVVEIIDEVNSPQRFYRLSLVSPAELAPSGLSQPTSGRILLHFDAKPGQSYIIEYSDSLTSSSWQVLTRISPVSETSTITVCDPDSGQVARFYRVRSF
jgi:hypothetical protein